MSWLRRVVLWVAVNVPLGPLNPRLLGYALSSTPEEQPEQTEQPPEQIEDKES